MGVQDELADLLSAESLVRAGFAAVALAVLLPIIGRIMAAGSGVFPGVGMILAALLLATGLALHAGRERLPADLVLIAMVLGVGSILGQFVPQLAVDLSLSGTALITSLAAAYTAMGLGARLQDMVL